MNPISKTAFYCAGLRMLDANGPDPICGDDYAKCFSDNSSLELLDRLENFEQHKIANLFRHKIIDDVIKDKLSRQPETRIILIGAGLDTRAFRLNGGIWIEIDEPEIIDYKNTRLPAADCGNPLVRIAHSFSRESLDRILRPCQVFSDVMIVIEGVLRYLKESEVYALLLALNRTFSAYGLLCDLMSREFFEQYGGATSNVLTELGAPVRFHGPLDAVPPDLSP